jgi:hypothetical protein
MKHLLSLLLLLPATIGNAQVVEKGQVLFNGKDLSGWDTYIGMRYDTVIGKRTGAPAGLNTDPDGVFTVVQEDGRPALRISGQHFGGISTQQEFSNFHLRVEFKWGDEKWAPRKKAKRDSGILYHAVGPHGKDGGSWMRSQEFQVQETDCGDYWGVAGALFDIPASQTAAGYVYDAAATMLTFSAASPQGRHCIRQSDEEKTPGQWNVAEVYCYGDTAVHIVNGKVVMVLYRSRQVAEGGGEMPLVKGKIQLQSEGAEVFYRNMMLTAIDRIPVAVLPGK